MKTLVWGHYCRVQVPGRGKSERTAGRRRLEWGLLDQVGFGQKEGWGTEQGGPFSSHTHLQISKLLWGHTFWLKLFDAPLKF